jgi:hypothetical protein
MIHYLDQICDWLVLVSIDEPFAKVALYGRMEHSFLLTRQIRLLNLQLDFLEFLCSKVHHFFEFLRAKEQ